MDLFLTSYVATKSHCLLDLLPSSKIRDHDQPLILMIDETRKRIYREIGKSEGFGLNMKMISWLELMGLYFVLLI